MNGLGYVGTGILILLLLPAVVLPWEGRRVSNLFYAAIALGGLTIAALRGGSEAIVWSAFTGLVTLIAIAALATSIRVIINLQFITSNHIRLLSAGSTWLGFAGSVVMISISLAVLFGLAFVRHYRPVTRRPDLSAIAALVILCVSIQQIVPARGPATARAVISAE